MRCNTNVVNDLYKNTEKLIVGVSSRKCHDRHHYHHHRGRRHRHHRYHRTLVFASAFVEVFGNYQDPKSLLFNICAGLRICVVIRTPVCNYQEPQILTSTHSLAPKTYLLIRQFNIELTGLLLQAHNVVFEKETYMLNCQVFKTLITSYVVPRTCVIIRQ